MFAFRILLMAFNGLRTNLLRSILATLGVIIGVASVVSAMSILEGAQRDIIDKFQSFGSNQLTIVPGDRRSRGRSMGQTNTLRVSDADAIMAECPSVVAGGRKYRWNTDDYPRAWMGQDLVEEFIEKDAKYIKKVTQGQWKFEAEPMPPKPY